MHAAIHLVYLKHRYNHYKACCDVLNEWQQKNDKKKERVREIKIGILVSYVSINCIRFTGLISASLEAPRLKIVVSLKTLPMKTNRLMLNM